MNKSSKIWGKRAFSLAISLSLVLLSTFGRLSLASQSENVQHYKLLSILEYSGESQFSSEFETVCTVKKLVLPDDRAQYFLSTSSPDVAENDIKSGEKSSLKELSFTVDGKTQHLSAMGRDWAFLEKVSNGCARHLKKVTKENLEKTWKQRFVLSSLDNSLTGELRFTLTAMPIRTEAFGELVAVRALSEPFLVKTAKDTSDVGSVRCRVNCVYVFDPEFEEIYLSISVFKAATNAHGFNEVLQHSVSTCKADAAGRRVDFSDLGKDKDFKKFVSKIGVTNSLEVVRTAPLPQWAQSDGVRAAQVANICAAVSCEGALNPVATVYLPAARVVDLQSSNNPITTGAPLAASEGQAGGWDWFGWNWSTAAWGTGITFGTLGAAGAFADDDTEIIRSPVTP